MNIMYVEQLPPNFEAKLQNSLMNPMGNLVFDCGGNTIGLIAPVCTDGGGKAPGGAMFTKL